jgi:hypothetical protein
MAWRLHEHVLRGEIDNRTRGRVSGRIRLADVEEPLVLELHGDCYSDLAGCLLRFENPRPVAMPTKPPAPQQRGTAGDITAARKARVFDIRFEEADPRASFSCSSSEDESIGDENEGNEERSP